MVGQRLARQGRCAFPYLRDYDIIDEQSFIQALAGYYCRNGGSFDGLRIVPEYADRFDSIKDWAVEYYDYD